MTGQLFGRLTVKSQAESTVCSRGWIIRQWYCECRCGATRVVRECNLLSGNTRSCGCAADEARRRKRRAA